MPKTGRPPKQGNTRNVNLQIRLTENEAQDLKECADKLNISRTEVIVRGVKLVKVETAK